MPESTDHPRTKAGTVRPRIRVEFTLAEAQELLAAGETAIDHRGSEGLGIPAALRFGVLRLRDALGGS
jgi:hypothetical protein